jgi:hypothetical protein
MLFHSFAVVRVLCHISIVLSRVLLISFYPIKNSFSFPALSLSEEKSAQPACGSDTPLYAQAQGRNKPLLVVMLRKWNP